MSYHDFYFVSINPSLSKRDSSGIVQNFLLCECCHNRVVYEDKEAFVYTQSFVHYNSLCDPLPS